MEQGIVVTSANGRVAEQERAAVVAANTGWRQVERRGALPALMARETAALAYVVGRAAEQVTDGQARLQVERGLLHAKESTGDAHPLIRALGPVRTVLDGTLGLAGDALHIAAVTGATVLAAEASPVVYELVSSGLARLEHPAAKRIAVHHCTAGALYAQHPAVDVVFLAPMFVTPAKAAPGYALFRRIADHRPVRIETWANCGTRVVVRVEKHQAAPFAGMERLRGKAVDYWISLPRAE